MSLRDRFENNFFVILAITVAATAAAVVFVVLFIQQQIQDEVDSVVPSKVIEQISAFATLQEIDTLKRQAAAALEEAKASTSRAIEAEKRAILRAEQSEQTAEAIRLNYAEVSKRVEALDAAIAKSDFDAAVQEIAASPFLRNAVLKEFLPASAVVAFDSRDGCPPNWSQFDPSGGRMIIGAGPHPNAGLTTYPSFSEDPGHATGGEETVTLTVPQMPAHSHNVSSGDIAGGTDLADSNQLTFTRNVPSGIVGEGQPHNNMPPYIALYFCKKD